MACDKALAYVYVALLITFAVLGMWVLNGCTTMPQPPPIELCNVDMPAQVCHRFKKDAAGIWQYQGDRLPAEWDKAYLITPTDLMAVKKYSRDLATWITNNVK